MMYRAHYDSLTNLPNRIFFDQAFDTALRDAAAHSKRMAVMFLDLDEFKQVNDRLGHAIGDQLLQTIVQRLSHCLREADVIARWGGDEFVILLPQIRCRDDASEVAGRLIEVCQPEFYLGEHRLHTTVSIGVAIYPDDGLDNGTLLQNADTALYRAKRSGRNNYQYYSADVAS